MNKQRRMRLEEALEFLSKAESIAESARDEEADGVSNYPENLQDTERYEMMEEAVDSLDEALDLITDAENSIRRAIDQ